MPETLLSQDLQCSIIIGYLTWIGQTGQLSRSKGQLKWILLLLTHANDTGNF